MTFWENIPNPHLKCRCDSSSFSKHEFQYSRTWDRIFCFFWFHFFHRAVNRHSKDSSCTSSGEFIGFLGAGRSSMQSSSLSVSSPDWKTALWLIGPFSSRQLTLSCPVIFSYLGTVPSVHFELLQQKLSARELSELVHNGIRGEELRIGIWGVIDGKWPEEKQEIVP